MPTPVPDAIEDPATILVEEVAAYLSIDNELRPHEAVDFRPRRQVHRTSQHLFWASTLQEDGHDGLQRQMRRPVDA
jgi:hypothetical protein